ncbi:MAG: ATP-binding protein, partial [Synergistaceae bacterium]|nr:ATP-binding protein [Synergistaceae bacterium]
MIRQRERDAIIKSLAAGVVPKIGLHHIQVDRKDEIMAMIADLERVREG